jgi:hypothetical protein
MKYIVSVLAVYCFGNERLAWYAEYDNKCPYDMTDQMRHLVEVGI